MSWLTRIALKKRWLTFLIVALISGASVWGTLTLNMELIPDIDFPMTTVVTVYPQADPEEVMHEVTVPVEDAIASVPGLDHINSTSVEGMTFTLAMFEYGTDMNDVNNIIRQNLSELDLPPEVLDVPNTMPQVVENPQLIPLNISNMPVVTFSFSGDMNLHELEYTATAEIIPRLEAIDGTYNVLVAGGGEEMVLVNMDPGKLIEFGISVSQMADVLALGEYDSLDEIENAVLSDDVLLSDVAGVDLGPSPGTAITRTNGQPSLTIAVTKDADANTVSVANAVVYEAEKIAETLGDGLRLVTVFDQSDFIENSISDLARNALIGTVLAVIVVFLFLMAFRASLVTAVSIPLSLLIGFLAMRGWGLTINLLTLSAMVIAVGRAIDNSIVVLEVMFRRMRGGETFGDAALNGVREIAAPITSATVATVVIFAPLALVGGIVGEMFVPFALTITFTLVASLLVALMIVPPLSNFTKSIKSESGVREAWYQGMYARVLQWSLGHRGVILIVAAALFFGSFALIPLIGTSFIPPMGEEMATVEIRMPPGTGLVATEEVAIRAEEVIGNNPEVARYLTTVGTSGSLFGGMSALSGAGSNTATIEVYLNSGADVDENAAELRTALETVVSGGTIAVTASEGTSSGMSGSGLAVSILGSNYEDIVLTARQLFGELEGMEGIENLEIDITEVEPSLDIRPDPSRFMAAGLPPAQFKQVGQEFRMLMMGGPVAEASVDGDRYSVFLEGVAPSLESVEIANQMRIGWPTSVSLGEIAEVNLGEQQVNIKRTDQQRAATVTGSITAENVGAINVQVQKKIDALSVPLDVEVTMGGTAESMEESFSDMFMAIIIAVALAYAVLVFAFRSFLTPFILMVSLPLASIGAFLGLLIAGQPLGMSAMMGILMLIGIVLTNAIVLISVVEQMRKRGMSSHDALVDGGKTRLRPILMTALTTMLAMLPLALIRSSGTLIGAELATVVIGGLFSSTLLTLLVIPVLYSLLEGLRSRVKRRATS